MEEAKGLYLCQYRKKDYSDTPYESNLENGIWLCFGQNNDEIKSVGPVYENGKRGMKFLFIHGDDQEEKVLFVGDTAMFYYSYLDISGPTDWEEVDNYIYLKLIEKQTSMQTTASKIASAVLVSVVTDFIPFINEENCSRDFVSFFLRFFRKRFLEKSVFFY